MPEAREASPEKAGPIGLFAGTGISDGIGQGPPLETEVSDSGGDGSIRAELLRLLRLPVSELTKQTQPGRLTSGQAIARALMTKATLEQSQSAIELVLDRIEGKPTKAAQNKSTNSHITEQLDQSLDSLDKLTEK